MEDAKPPESSTELQFDQVEYSAEPPAFACASCTRPVAGEYFEASGKFICPACHAGLVSTSGTGRTFRRALGYGAAAALLGGLVWWGVRRVTGYEIGLIAVGVGLIVGIAVRAGARGRGGLRYQVLAAFLTYTGIALNYAPDVASALLTAARSAEVMPATGTGGAIGRDERPRPDAPMADDADGIDRRVTSSNDEEEIGVGASIFALGAFVAIVVGLSYAAPFLGGLQNVIGILIIGFALFEAWRINRRTPISGPFRTGADRPTRADDGS